ncbi:MAG: transketolase [Methanomassiliicoccaceae archaeon]|jgi:transketolase|nr:transketolase [Methanomassiliicoccaceae archaeon]
MGGAKGLDVKDLRRRADKIRMHVIEMTSEAGSGHPGGSLSSADLFAVLYFHVLRHDPKDPEWEGRDKFVLSKGHVAPVLYAALAESGYFPVDELLTLRKIGSRLQGHPVKGKPPGVEMSTGSLGQGLSMSCGLALAAKLDKKDTRVYCLLGDGELQSGQNWEAMMLASHYDLNNLTIFIDRNHLQIMGSTEKTMSIDPLAYKLRAFGLRVISIDGHDIKKIIKACEKARSSSSPTAIILNTVKGKGVSFMENNADFHGRSCKPDEKEKALKELTERMSSW